MLNLSPNTQKPTVYTNFLLGSRTCFLFLSFWVGHLGQAMEFGVLVFKKRDMSLGSLGRILLSTCTVRESLHGTESLVFVHYYNRQGDNL